MRPDFLTGTIDLHIHSGPDVIPRIGTSIDIARAAANAGMRAVVFKDHVFPSFVKAALTQQIVPEILVFGGICLNASVGGLNVNAVKGAIAGGAKVVMFPTFDSRVGFSHPDMFGGIQKAHLKGEAPKLVATVDDDGNLLPEAERVLQVLAEHPDVILSSGHLGPEELVPLVDRAGELGITRMVVEHPNAEDWFSTEQLRHLVSAGATINISYNPYCAMIGRRDPREAVRMIRTLGVEHCTLISDGGQPYNPMPAETMRVFCEMLHHLGLTVDEIYTMTRTNPARLLGLMG
ncbi:MAG: hypothetical protein HY675_07470 [Chloroflexi bacterium]|nr:hypothetical protein [Chloroflexota bacterium]